MGRLPYVLSGVGLLFGLILLGELSIHSLGSEYEGFLTGVITSIPFIIGHIYAGYWLEQSAIPSEQYGRIARWWVGGVLLTVLIIGWINISMQLMSLQIVIGTVRWSGAIGGGVGLMIGILQVQAIQKAVEAERVRYQLQETQQEREKLEKFASIVSHDLRNPLNVAQGRVTLAREECDSEHLNYTQDALKRMQELIDDLLTLARAGTEVSDFEPVNMASLTENCWKNVATAEATLTVDINRTIQADRSRLQQLLENLLRNAVEHGGNTVTITIGDLDDGFYLEDDGPGIPENERNDVFETGYSTTEGGTGFGLSIVKQIATAHGWEICVTEGSEGGARFEVRSTGTTAE